MPKGEYVARGRAYSIVITPTQILLSLARKGVRPPPKQSDLRESPSLAGETRLRVRVLDARSEAQVVEATELPGTSNYFIGNDARKWRQDVPGYSSVRYGEVYPGIDLVYYGSHGELEYDFVVAPGGDPSKIRLGLEGTHGTWLDGEGNLQIAFDGGELILCVPRVYQQEGSTRHTVQGRWVLYSEREVGFEVDAYDKGRTLVLDPRLSYSTYLGGSNVDGGYQGAIAVDSAGNAYVTGRTLSPDFPTQAPYQTYRGGYDVFVTKLSPSGTSLVYSTYLGGSGYEAGLGIAVDSSGSAYVTGETDSGDFPTQAPYQTYRGALDAFVTKLSPSGASLIYSTYLGGAMGGETAFAIAVDGMGSAYVTGETTSTDFPTQNPYQTYQGDFDAFVTKFSPAGGSLLYSTYLGGQRTDVATGIALDPSGSAYITGATDSLDFPTLNAFQASLRSPAWPDAFVTKLSPSGSSLMYSTYLGGSLTDIARGIAVDGSGSAYVTGEAGSPDFPVQNPYQTGPSSGAFVTKFSSSGSTLVYSTYLGGILADYGQAIAVDGAGSAYVTGQTESTDFPIQDPYQTDQAGNDAFVTKLSPSGTSLKYSTYLGGSGLLEGAYGIAVDRLGYAYVTGYTDSPDFPTQNPYQGNQPDRDVFVTKLGREAMAFYAVAPCRLIDTRGPTGPYGGPALAAGAERVNDCETVAGRI
jgi:hypothetical protein